MGDDPGVTGDQNGIGKFHWSRSPAQVDSVRMGVFGNCFFGTSPEGAASAERAVMETAAHGKRWANPSPTTVDQCFSE